MHAREFTYWDWRLGYPSNTVVGAILDHTITTNVVRDRSNEYMEALS